MPGSGMKCRVSRPMLPDLSLLPGTPEVVVWLGLTSWMTPDVKKI